MYRCDTSRRQRNCTSLDRVGQQGATSRGTEGVDGHLPRGARRSYRRTVAEQVPRRDVVDHALARRALLRELYGGGLFATTSSYDVCDASPFLKSAAREYGARTDRSCPVCRRELLWEVSWVYGDAIAERSGTARSARQLAALARAYPDFAVYEVEVCQDCGWNHLVRTYRTGTPGTAPARRARRELHGP